MALQAVGCDAGTSRRRLPYLWCVVTCPPPALAHVGACHDMWAGEAVGGISTGGGAGVDTALWLDPPPKRGLIDALRRLTPWPRR